MSLVTFNEILPQARAEKRAVCAFNVVNCETAVAALRAAESERQPVILQVYQRLFQTGKAQYVAALVRHLAQQASIPVVLHLDHGQTLDQIRMAVDYGFTSVMFDGSVLPFRENVAQTAMAVKIAHDAGITIEGEVGHVPYKENDPTPLPTADEVLCFSQETGVDAVAPAIGTSHGFYKTIPVIQTDLARQIGRMIDKPLVIHGGSDTPEEKIRELIAAGFSKLNIATEFMAQFILGIQQQVASLEGQFIPVDLFMDPVIEKMIVLAKQKIQLASAR